MKLDEIKARAEAATPGPWWAETVDECETADGPKELKGEIPAKKIHFICCKNYKRETNADSLTVALTRRDRVVIHEQEARLLGTVGYVGDFDEEDKANAEFIASAREIVPALIAYIEELEGQIHIDPEGEIKELRAKGEWQEAELERLKAENLSFHAQATGYYEETVRLKAQLETEILRRDSLDEALNNVVADHKRDIKKLAAIREAAGPMMKFKEAMQLLKMYNGWALYRPGNIVTLSINDFCALAEAIKEEK